MRANQANINKLNEAVSNIESSIKRPSDMYEIFAGIDETNTQAKRRYEKQHDCIIKDTDFVFMYRLIKTVDDAKRADISANS